MKILSDTFKIEATYDELLFMYEGMMKSLDELINKRRVGVLPDREEIRKKDELCFELSIILGKKDEFLRIRERQNDEELAKR